MEKTISAPPNPLESPGMKPEETLQTQASKTTDCNHCKFPVRDNFYYCPNCGKKLKEPPFKFSILKTIGLIIFSILLPPLGLIPGVKYLFKKESVAKIIGLILIIISLIATFIILRYLVNTTNQMLKIYSDIYQMQGTSFGNSEQELTPQYVIDQLNALQ